LAISSQQSRQKTTLAQWVRNSSRATPYAKGETLLLLCSPMCPQIRYGVRGERYRASAILRLWSLNADPVGDGLFERPLDPKAPCIKINVSPAQGQYLAAPQAGCQTERSNQVKRLAIKAIE